ncbi:MAG: hypothetical protein R6U89_06080 [Dehalococcoidia bacterium]
MEENQQMPEKEEVDRRKKEVGETLCCPYCRERMKKWAVPQTLFTTWPNEYMYICFNDECPYLLRGIDAMESMGNAGAYRLMYDPLNDCCQPIPILNRQALKDGIVGED